MLYDTKKKKKKLNKKTKVFMEKKKRKKAEEIICIVGVGWVYKLMFYGWNSHSVKNLVRQRVSRLFSFI